jgi:kynurenine formamidase
MVWRNTGGLPLVQGATLYKLKYGKRGNSSVFAADYPVHQIMGPARVIDLTHLLGTTSPSEWPKSPAITVDDTRKHEKLYGPIQPGDVVLFKSGSTDMYYKPGVYSNRYVADALNGKIEGWPAPTPETMLYLAQKGVKCVGTDGASMGGVTGKEAVQTHWAGLTQGMNYPEFLTNLGTLPPKGAFFIWLPLKEEGVPGGVGRAVAILP